MDASASINRCDHAGEYTLHSYHLETLTSVIPKKVGIHYHDNGFQLALE